MLIKDTIRILSKYKKKFPDIKVYYCYGSRPECTIDEIVSIKLVYTMLSLDKVNDNLKLIYENNDIFISESEYSTLNDLVKDNYTPLIVIF